MNRTIKFRAWDGERMIYDVQNIYDTIIRLKTSDGEDVDQCDTKLPCVSDFGALLSCENVPIMQFTGLMDKNGKEIYEGDIVKNGFGSTYVIESCVGGFHCVDDGFVHAFSVLNQNCEVIGNIHENPDLIK